MGKEVSEALSSQAKQRDDGDDIRLMMKHGGDIERVWRLLHNPRVRVNLVQFCLERGPTPEKFREVSAQLLQRLQKADDAVKPDWPRVAFYVQKYSQDFSGACDSETDMFPRAQESMSEILAEPIRIFLEIRRIINEDQELKDVTMIGKLVLPAPVGGALPRFAGDCGLAGLNGAQEIMVHIQNVVGEHPWGSVYVVDPSCVKIKRWCTRSEYCVVLEGFDRHDKKARLYSNGGRPNGHLRDACLEILYLDDLPMIGDVRLAGTSYGGDLKKRYSIPQVELPGFPKLGELINESDEESEDGADDSPESEAN